MSRESLNLPYIVLTGVIIVAIMVAFLVIWPLLGKGQEKNQELATLQDTLMEKEKALLIIDRQKSELLQQAENEKVLQVVLPADDALEDISRIIYRYAQATGVTINSINNNTTRAAAVLAAARARGQDTEVPASVVPITTSLDIGGTYQQYRSFIESLQRSPRLGDITALQLSHTEQQPPDVVNGKLEINFYKYQPQTDGQ